MDDSAVKCTLCGALISGQELFCPRCRSMQIEVPVEPSMEYQKFRENYEMSKEMRRAKEQEAMERYLRLGKSGVNPVAAVAVAGIVTGGVWQFQDEAKALLNGDAVMIAESDMDQPDQDLSDDENSYDDQGDQPDIEYFQTDTFVPTPTVEIPEADVEEETEPDFEIINETDEIFQLPESTDDLSQTTVTYVDTSGEYSPDGYIIPDSNSRYLTREELSELTGQQLNYAKNEIFARHGRKFSSSELSEYFNSKTWYNGTIEGTYFDQNYTLSDVENENARLLKELEYELYPNGYPLRK